MIESMKSIDINYYSLEKEEDYYILGEWKYDSKKDKFNHIDHGRIEQFTLGRYFEEIEKKI